MRAGYSGKLQIETYLSCDKFFLRTPAVRESPYRCSSCPSSFRRKHAAASRQSDLTRRGRRCLLRRRPPISLRAIAAFPFATAAAAGCIAVDAGAIATPPNLFFDDFSYTAPGELAAGGWQLRDGVGHQGAARRPLQRRRDPRCSTIRCSPGSRVLRMTASTDGTGPGTVQAQLAAHQRKYLQGTYAARIRFSDAPRSGIDGDPVIESFYAVAPLAHPFDPDFSELDWEYLPNGGWGSEKTRLYGVSWQTVQIDPWEAHNSAH